LEQPEGISESVAESAALPVGTSLEAMEQQMIVATLEYFDGHRAKTAEALGIGVRTLSGKLRSYGFAPRAKTNQQANRPDVPVLSAISAGRGEIAAGFGNKKAA
jgi:hypothetical protein